MNIGEHARELRMMQSLPQQEAAELLGISNVHLCNIEAGKSVPSPDLLDRMNDLYGADVYVYAWCQSGDINKLPKPLRDIASSLAIAWKRQMYKRQSASK